MRRVVVTGIGGVTALGNDWPTIKTKIEAGQTAIRYMPDWERFHGVNTRLGAPVEGFSVEERYPRKKLRSMGRVAQMAVYASEKALEDGGMLESPALRSGRVGVAYGSSFGSPPPVIAFAELMEKGASRTLNGTSYVQMMSQTAAVNISVFFGLTGRLIPTSSACTASSQAIGYAAEAIRWGAADAMLAGGGDELDITAAAVFDTLFATSVKNDKPDATPAPYDRDRDGLVIGEGAVTFLLEERERALARGAKIHAEIVGYGTNTDGDHVTQPKAETMAEAMRLALADARLAPEAIGFVSGHGTATEGGDIAETRATAEVLGHRAPIHSLKSYYGHSLGACGAIEAWLGIEMMREGRFAPTANLRNRDPRCAELDYIMGASRRIETEYLMSNNFAFGGINTSLILKRV